MGYMPDMGYVPHNFGVKCSRCKNRYVWVRRYSGKLYCSSCLEAIGIDDQWLSDYAQALEELDKGVGLSDEDSFKNHKVFSLLRHNRKRY